MQRCRLPGPQRDAGRGKPPPGQIACRRFKGPLRLLENVLAFAPDAAIPFHRDVHAEQPRRPDPDVRRIEVDASPWGGGGILYVKGKPKSYFAVRWDPQECSELGLEVGSSSSQTAFECLVLLLGVLLWAKPSAATLLLGDNTAALQECIALKGKGTLLEVSRKLAVVRARRTLWLWVAHLPNEANTAADALSRLEAPGEHAKRMPAALARASRRVPPSISDLGHEVLVAA